MSDFEFQTVPRILMEQGAARSLGPFLKNTFSAHTAVIVTDKGVIQAGLLEGALGSLRKAGVEAQVIDDVIADPPEHMVLALAEKVKGAGDVIIGFGGGSSMDTAKLLAVLAKGEQDLASMYGIDQISSARMPMVMIPTTAGTGSEVTPISIVTTGETTKAGIVSPVLYADVAILDPELTLSLPPHVTAATGIDAMVHAIEAFTSKHKKNPLSDTLAMKALRLLSQAVPNAYRDGSDVKARSDALLGSMLAGQAFANAPVAAVHALAYPLGGIYHLPHGLSNALVLPYVIEFNRKYAVDHYAALYTHVTGDENGSPDARSCRFAEYIIDLCETVGMRQKLRDLNISHNRLPELAEDAMKQTRLLGNNPRDVTYEDALRIYEQAW